MDNKGYASNMSFFNNQYPQTQTYRIKDFYPNGRFNDGKGMTFEEAVVYDNEFYVKYPIIGNWQYIAFPINNIYIGNGLNFQLAGPNTGDTYIFKAIYNKYGLGNKGLTCVAETYPFIFTSLKKVKELESLNLAYKGTGIIPNVEIGRQRNFNDEIMWTTVTPFTNKEGYTQYFIREVGEYKYIRFRISWNNTETKYISELTAVSITIKTLVDKQR